MKARDAPECAAIEMQKLAAAAAANAGAMPVVSPLKNGLTK